MWSKDEGANSEEKEGGWERWNRMKSVYFFFFKQKTAYEMCGRDWSSDVCSSDLYTGFLAQEVAEASQQVGYDFSGVIIPQDSTTEADRKSVV